MTVLVESKNIEVTQALRDHIIKHAQKLSKIGKNILGVRVFLETVAKKNNDPHANKVTFSVLVPGKDIVVRKQAVDMYVAVVEAAHAAVRYVRKAAERRMTKSRHGHSATPAIAISEADLSFS